MIASSVSGCGSTYPCQLSFGQQSLGFAPPASREARDVALGANASDTLTAPGKLEGKEKRDEFKHFIDTSTNINTRLRWAYLTRYNASNSTTSPTDKHTHEVRQYRAICKKRSVWPRLNSLPKFTVTFGAADNSKHLLSVKTELNMEFVWIKVTTN